MSSCRRKRPKMQTPPSERNQNGQQTPRRADVPPELPGTDTTRIRMIPDPESPPPFPEDGGAEPASGSGNSNGSGGGSRFNRLVDGLRSRLLFPDAMKTAIDELAAQLVAERKPKTTYATWCLGEIARAMTQIDIASDQMLVNDRRVLERVDLCWSDDRRLEAIHRAARLAQEPHRVAPELENTKYGALLMITRLEFLGKAIRDNGALDDLQREALFDLRAIEPIFRKNSREVPAGDDKPALIELVAREIARHRDNLKNALDARDAMDHQAARVGILKTRDAESKKLRGDELRARRRLVWAEKTFQDLQAGTPAATIIDPETGQSINPQERAAAPPKKPTADAASPTPTSPPSQPPAEEPASPPSENPLPPVPDGYPDELRDTMFMVAGMIREMMADPSGEPPLATPPAEPAGPPA